MAKTPQMWSPFSELDRFRREFDDLFDRVLGGGLRSRALPAAAEPAIECYIEGNHLVVRADLPGIDPKEVEVTVTGDNLTVRGRRERRQEHKERNFIHREISYGSFERSIELPQGVKANEVKAAYHDGVLELTIPIPREMTVRKVPIEIARSEK